MKAKSQFRENRGKVSQDFEDWSSVATCNYYSSHVTVIHLTRSLALSLDLSEINKKKKKIDEFILDKRYYFLLPLILLQAVAATAIPSSLLTVVVSSTQGG